MTASTPALGEALATLAAAATDAGLDPDRARAEGEALAATVAESAKGAHVDWIAHTSGTSAQDFFDAASRGRRWRATPTVLLSELAQTDRGRARPYAVALADVCTSASQLGAPGQRVLGNAALAASAQLAAVGGADTPHLPPARQTPPPGRTSPSTSVDPAQSVAAAGRLEAVRTTGQQVLQRLLDQVANPRSAGARGPGNPLDVAAADGPGAFPGLGGTGIADPELLRRLRPGATPTDANADRTTPSPVPPNQSEGTQPAEGAGATEEDRTRTAGTAPAVEAAEEPVEDPPTLEELLAELDALIGLDSVKAEIHRQVAVLRVEKLRTEAGLAQPTITRHLIFTGNPGTGKTTVARLVAGIYRALGLLSKGQLVEVDRSELVAGYLGQTALKTSEVVESAVGGVLFIDEAYSLAGDQYGTEAVDTLVKETEDKRDDLVVIVAGYPDPMEVFIAQNPGLSSRFRTTIAFEDYTDDELGAIFASMATAADYDLTEDTERRFRSILATTPRGSTFGNGRFARNCLEGAIGRHAWRLRDVDAPTVDQLRAIAADDLEDEPSDPDADCTDEPPAVADRPAVEDVDE
ncbi:MAG: AAA family ATPase [Propionibacteriaceae bacterium]